MTNTTQQGRTPVWVLTVTSFHEDYVLDAEVALSEARAYDLAKVLIANCALTPKPSGRTDYPHHKLSLLRKAWDSGSVYDLLDAWNSLYDAQIQCDIYDAYTPNNNTTPCPF